MHMYIYVPVIHISLCPALCNRDAQRIGDFFGALGLVDIAPRVTAPLLRVAEVVVASPVALACVVSAGPTSVSSRLRFRSGVGVCVTP